MGGFSVITGNEFGSVMNADNASFDGTTRDGVLSANGELWIGSSSSPRVKVGSLTSPLGTLQIGYSSPNVTLDLAGGSAGIDSVGLDTGTTPIVPDGGGMINMLGAVVAAGTNPIRTDGTTANTATIEVQLAAAITGAPANNLNAGLASFDDVFHAVDANGFVDLTANWEATSMHGWNGSIIESAAVSAASDGATITFSVEKSGGGDLTVVFSDPDLYYTWVTTPADTVALTPGTDTVPVQNFVYFLNSTKTLTTSTVGWPATEHAPLATVLCQTAATFQTDGAYKFHAWTDHVVASDKQGHIGDLNFWIRQQPATWISGVTQTYTITPNGGAADNVILTTTSGVVLQLHEHAFPAFAGTPDVYVVNDFTTPFTKVTDLNALLTDATGASMSGRYFSLVIWGCVSEDTGDCKLYVNLPLGSYGTSAGVLDDVDAFSVYTIPPTFKGTGFLISEWKLRHQVVASGTWTSVDEISLLGLFPSLSAGGVPGSITFTTDAGVATPSGNNINILGGTGITVTGAGETITIDSSTGGFLWTDVSGAFSPLPQNGYFVIGTATGTLPVAPTQGQTIKFFVDHASQLLTIQTAGTQIIRVGSSVSSAGGTIVSILQGDSVELTYRASDDCWCAIAGVTGTWTIT